MLKRIELSDFTLLIEWKPSSVADYLYQNQIDALDMVQGTREQIKQLSKDLFLLAAKASLSEEDKHYALFLSHYARVLQQAYYQQDKPKRRQALKEQFGRNPVQEPATIDGLQARLFHLMTQYSVQPCRHLAAGIVQALTHLCQHPHIELLPEQRCVYSQAINLWRSRLMTNNAAVSSQVH